MARWVLHLQTSRGSLDAEARTIDVVDVQARIEACAGQPSDDAFTRERRAATAAHLQRLLDHHEAIQVEADRTGALVDYALAYLEEARAGLILGRRLAGDAAPTRLAEVLGRLREHAAEGDARRRTAREVSAMA